jgi:hypothetical protein
MQEYYYPNTNVKPQIGDIVSVDYENKLTVESLAFTAEDKIKSGLTKDDEPSLTLIGKPYGSLCTSIFDCELEFVSREPTGL